MISLDRTISSETHEAFFIADLAQRWLTGIGDEPFFLRVDTWGPHPPYLLAAPFVDMLECEGIELPENFYSKLEDRPGHHRAYRDYWHDTLNLDESAWRQMYQRALEHAIQVETALCALLEQVDLDDTLVIFNSDHGDAVGSNGAVANKGGLMTEATMQIPLLIAGAGLPAAESREQIVSNLDLVPTLADICGIETDREFHGKSLLTLIEEPENDWREGFLVQHYGLHERIVQRAWYEGEWKLILQADGFEELYRLSEDPGETKNLAIQGKYKARIADMSRELYSSMDAVKDTDFRPQDYRS